MIQLTPEEFQDLRSRIVISNRPAGRGGRRYPPFVFTEHVPIVDTIQSLMPPPGDPHEEPFGFRRARKN
jgi:hypothetical protein